VHGYVDLHIHLAAHLAVPVYGDGPASPMPAKPSARHALRPQLFAAELERADATILVSLAYAHPFTTAFETRRTMAERVGRQLAFVEDFCRQHSARFTCVRTPAEARAAIAGGRTAIVQGVEGATRLVVEPADAAAWAARGVVVVTPVHLADNPIGGALCMGGGLALLNLRGCVRQALGPSGHGLTRRGVELVGAMMDAGMVLDLAHTSPASFRDLYTLVAARRVAPVYTHVQAQALTGVASALSDEELRAIYRLHGLVGVTSNVHGMTPRPRPAELPTDYCPGSIDDFAMHYDHVVDVVVGAPLGWGSDFQGGISHPRPKYGPKGCRPMPSDGSATDAVDTLGLAHVGLTPAWFRHLAAGGSDRAPLDASAERFLQIWERARGERETIAD
jgi:microsomal dipeptidase-like Zn-dependent dipeptidase